MRTKKAIANIITSVLVQIISIVYGFIIPKLIISTYGSNVNGLVTSITQFLAYIVLLESGFGPVIKSILFKPIANKDKNEIGKILKASERIFRTIAYIFIAYIIILCAVLPFVLENDFSPLYTVSLIIIIAISTFAEYYFGMTYSIFLQADQKKYIISIIQIGTLILNTAIILLLVNLNCSIQIVKLASCLIFVLRPILQNIYVKKKYNINLKNIDSGYKIKQKWDGLVQHLAYVVYTNTDVVILTVCTNLKEVSVYSVYLLITDGLKRIVQSFAGGIDATFGDMIAKGEQDNLNKKFKLYEGIYITISTIAFCSTLFLIVPFVKLYTKGINDANYIRPVFAYLIVIAEFVYIIRQLYYDLVKVAGHFKQTKKGAYIEAISNIVVSFSLVWNFGLIGVAIGTLVAMTIRTIEIIFYTSKNILNRNVWYTYKRIIVSAFEFIIVAIIINLIPCVEIKGYMEWIIQAIITVSVSSVIVISVNSLMYKDNVKDIIRLVDIKYTK